MNFDFEALNSMCLMVTDPVLNWLLYLPKSLAIFLVAVMTSTILTFSRKWTTNQDWLQRADSDVKRIDQLIKEAKKKNDKDAVQRYTMNVGLIKMKGLKFEGKPLLVAIIPIALLATWCFSRLGFCPPEADKPVEIRMCFPRNALSSVVHMIPQENVAKPEDGWIRKVSVDSAPVSVTLWDKGIDKVVEWFRNGFEWFVVDVLNKAVAPPKEMDGVAVWKVSLQPKDEPYVLQFACGGKIYKKEVLVGKNTYSTQGDIVDDGSVLSIEQVLKPVMFLGLIGGLGSFFPPWLVAYLLIAFPFFTILKKVFRIY